MNEPYKLPPGWKWVRLGEVCEPTQNRDSRMTPDMPFRYVNISSVDNRLKRIIEARTILGKDTPSRARQIIKAEDTLVSTTRPNLNAVALVPPELDNEICSTGFCVLRPTKLIDPLFLFSFVQTPYFIDTISGQVKGMLYPAVTDNQVRGVYLPLPPLPDQKRLASKLQELMQDVESARNACEKQLEAAKALPSAYLREAFESEEAKKWERKRLGEDRFFMILPSGVDYFDGIKEYLSTNSIQKDKITHIEAIITYKKRPSRANMQPKLNSVWFARMKNTVKVYSFIEDNKEEIEKFILSTGFAGILCKDGVYPDYLKQIFLHHTEFNKTKDELASGSTQQAVNNESIKLIPVPLPPLETQYRIASDLKEKMAYVEKLQSAICNQQSALNILPQAILRKTFRGEL